MTIGRYVHRFDIDDQHSLHIYQGSLVEVEADALVSSDDNDLSAGGGVSAALAQVAGDHVSRERSRLAGDGVLKLGDVARTSGGGLPCRYIYHAITIESFRHWMDEATLRALVASLLRRATEDGVRTLGMPALGTGVAGFDLARASEVIIEELLDRIVATPIRHIVLSLIGDNAQRLFYESLVRSRAPHCAAISLRRLETQLAEPLGKRGPSTVPADGVGQPEHGPDFAEPTAETGEQFPSLVDQARLAAIPAAHPKLVAGLAAVVLKHAERAEIERELLERPECYAFRGTVEQRLMEFLYLGERNLRVALGPALFRARDLRDIADELGEDCELARDPEQLIDLILRSLCFNLVAPPLGLTQHLARIDRLILDLGAPNTTDADRIAAAVEAAKVLEQVLKDILRLYGFYLFGPGFEQELTLRQAVPNRRDGGITKLTLGQARSALTRLEALVKKDPILHGLTARLGRKTPALLPVRLPVETTQGSVICEQALDNFIRWRNQEIVHDAPLAAKGPDHQAVGKQLTYLRAFLVACQAERIYPEVLRYEGTFENRNGERFVHFLDERNAQRVVRTDDKIDPRRHYYCFATNNPLHLFPVLVPKL